MADTFPDQARAGGEMATSCRLAAAATALFCCLTAGAASPVAPPLPRPTKDPIDLVAASSDFDYQHNLLHFTQVRITQGPMQVEADQASGTGLNFENSEWTFTGNVHMKVPDGKLDASSAVVTFRDNEIATALIQGSPAEFEQKLQNSPQIARGHASTIQYDMKGGSVHLTGAAWLTDGDNVIQGDTLIYDMLKQRVAANPGSTIPGGVHITINPKSQDKAGDKDSGKRPVPAPTPAPDVPK
jgi:lipopolysaccharide transport protein LptA